MVRFAHSNEPPEHRHRLPRGDPQHHHCAHGAGIGLQPGVRWHPLAIAVGNSVQLGKLGTLRLSFGSVGVEDVDQFNAATMIKNVKVIFTPSKELMSAIKDGLSFENVGVVDNGFTYASTRAYKEAKGQGGGSGSGSGGSGGEGGLEENPLG